MRRAIVIVGILALLVPLAAADPPDMPYRAFAPMLYNAWQAGYVPNNLIPNPGAEHGEFCWNFEYPGSGNIICAGDDPDNPDPYLGSCFFRFGGWYDMHETGQTADFYLDADILYALDFASLVWSNDRPLCDCDTLTLFLVTPGGYYHELFELTNRASTDNWILRRILISPAESGVYSLLFVAITDAWKDPVMPGNTNFYLDDLRLWEAASCQECVQCQVFDEPPTTYCQYGQGDECGGCCPGGDDCDGLNPVCPILPPPHVYREVGREATCYGAMEIDVDNGGPVFHLMPPERERP